MTFLQIYLQKMHTFPCGLCKSIAAKMQIIGYFRKKEEK